MATRKGVPPALEEYICLPPKDHLVVLTGTLQCTTTWLTARFVGATLAAPAATSPHESEQSDAETAVVLVSWLRDERFWAAEIRRTTVSINVH